MAEWIDLTERGYLSVELMNSIYNDFIYIYERLITAGHSVPEILDIQVTYSISPANILNKFNLVEQNIDNLHEMANYPDAYYISSFRWSKNTDMKKYLYSGVKRWINWLTDAKKHYDGDFETMYLTDKNGNQISDKNGNKILVYKEW